MHFSSKNNKYLDAHFHLKCCWTYIRKQKNVAQWWVNWSSSRDKIIWAHIHLPLLEKKNPSMSTMSHDEMEYNLSTFPLDQDEILFSQLYINSFIHHLTTVTGTLSVAGTVCVYFMYFLTLFIIVVCPVPFCSPAISCFSRLLFVRSGFHHSSIEAGSLFVHCYVRSYVWSTFMFRSMIIDKGLLNRTTLILNCICKTWIAMNCNYKYTFVLHAN